MVLTEGLASVEMGEKKKKLRKTLWGQKRDYKETTPQQTMGLTVAL